MTFDEYQKNASATDVFGGGKHDLSDPAFVDKILGLAGESGEVTDKFKKIIRDNGGKISVAARDEIIKELGDVLWFLALISEYLGVSFDAVAAKNIEKVTDRKKRGAIGGSGDNR